MPGFVVSGKDFGEPATCLTERSVFKGLFERGAKARRPNMFEESLLGPGTSHFRRCPWANSLVDKNNRGIFPGSTYGDVGFRVSGVGYVRMLNCLIRVSLGGGFERHAEIAHCPTAPCGPAAVAT